MRIFLEAFALVASASAIQWNGPPMRFGNQAVWMGAETTTCPGRTICVTVDSIAAFPSGFSCPGKFSSDNTNWNGIAANTAPTSTGTWCPEGAASPRGPYLPTSTTIGNTMFPTVSLVDTTVDVGVQLNFVGDNTMLYFGDNAAMYFGDTASAAADVGTGLARSPSNATMINSDAAYSQSATSVPSLYQLDFNCPLNWAGGMVPQTATAAGDFPTSLTDSNAPAFASTFGSMATGLFNGQPNMPFCDSSNQYRTGASDSWVVYTGACTGTATACRGLVSSTVQTSSGSNTVYSCPTNGASDCPFGTGNGNVVAMIGGTYTAAPQNSDGTYTIDGTTLAMNTASGAISVAPPPPSPGGSSSSSGGGGGGGGMGVLLYAIIGGAVLLIIIIIVVIKKKNNSDGSKKAPKSNPTIGFENPLYDQGHPGEGVYSAGTGDVAEAAYMDIPIPDDNGDFDDLYSDGQVNPGTSVGYMDVAPDTATGEGNGADPAYMDVNADSDGDSDEDDDY